jgi:hypothetical protein
MLSSEMLHKDYDHKVSVAKMKSLVVSLKRFVPKTNQLALNPQS